MRIFASNLNDRPHFLFWCYPHATRPVYRDLDECGAIVERCSFQASALVFPSIDLDTIEPGELNAYIAYSNLGSAEEDTLVEWRCYRNGEFRYRANFWELGDVVSQQRMLHNTIYVPSADDPKSLGSINLVALAYRVTAAHVFAERLLRCFSATVDEVKSGLDGIAGYGLGRLDQSQSFPQAPIAREDSTVFRSTAEDLRHGYDPYVLAGEALVALYRHFGWETKPSQLRDLIDDVREIAERAGPLGFKWRR
jgi:hypothetical protein